MTDDGEAFRHDPDLTFSRTNIASPDIVYFDTERTPKNKKDKKTYKPPRDMNIYELNVYIKKMDTYFDECKKKMKAYRWRRLRMKFMRLFCIRKQNRMHRYQEEMYESWKSFIPYYRQQRVFVEMYRNRKEWEKLHLTNTPFYSSAQVDPIVK